MGIYKLENSKEYFGIKHKEMMFFQEGTGNRPVLIRAKLIKLPKELRLLNIMSQSWKRPAKKDLPEPWPTDQLPVVADKLDLDIDDLTPVLITDRLKDVQATICRILTCKGEEILIEERLYEIIKDAKLDGEELELFGKHDKEYKIWFIYLVIGDDIQGFFPEYIVLQTEIEGFPYDDDDVKDFPVFYADEIQYGRLPKKKEVAELPAPAEEFDSEGDDAINSADDYDGDPEETFTDYEGNEIKYINRMYYKGLEVGIIMEDKKLIYYPFEDNVLEFKTKKALHDHVRITEDEDNKIVYLDGPNPYDHVRITEDEDNKIVYLDGSNPFYEDQYTFRGQVSRQNCNENGLIVFRHTVTNLKYTDEENVNWKNADDRLFEKFKNIDEPENSDCIPEYFPIVEKENNVEVLPPDVMPSMPDITVDIFLDNDHHEMDIPFDGSWKFDNQEGVNCENCNLGPYPHPIVSAGEHKGRKICILTFIKYAKEAGLKLDMQNYCYTRIKE